MKGDYRVAAELASELGLRTAIQVNGQYLRDITTEAVAALQEANEPEPIFFCRGDSLVELRVGDAGVSPEPLSQARLKGVLDRAADFVKVNAKGKEEPARPPGDVVDDILALPDLPLPRLKGISGAPVLLSDGTLLAADG